MTITSKHISRRNRFSRIKQSYKQNEEKQSGGSIFINSVFSKIFSIGYEFECGDLMVTHKGYPIKGSDNPDPSKEKFLIPRGIDNDILLHDNNCNPLGDYTIILGTETDSPLSGSYETHSKMYHFEQRHFAERKEHDDIHDLLDHNTPVQLLEKAGYDVYSWNLPLVFYNHTEILFTIFDRKNNCRNVMSRNIQHALNDEKCILNTMKTMIDTLHEFFIPADELFPTSRRTNECEHAGMRLSFFKPNPALRWIAKPIYYAVPTFIATPDDEPLNIFEDTLWVPQMTYCVNVEDILSVTAELAKFLTDDDLDHVNKSIKILDELMNEVYYETITVTTKTKKGGTKKSKKVVTKAKSTVNKGKKDTISKKNIKIKRRKLKPQFIEFCEKIKNVLFFAVYYFYTYYFYDNVDGKDIISIKNPTLYKNLFCFTFRHSIDEILDHYMETNPDEMNELKSYLKKNIKEDDIDISNKDPSVATKQLISYVSRSFVRVCESDYVYVPEQHVYDSNANGTKECERSINDAGFHEYIFSKFLKCNSNYFDFDRVNERVLIEYRCFHKNVIQSYNQRYPRKAKTLGVHKSLNEWKEMIDDLHQLRK